MRISRGAFKHALKSFYDTLLGAANLLNESEEVTTGASTKDTDNTVYETEVVTGGTAGAEDLDPTTGTIVGQRKLITLKTRTNASDVVNVVVTDVVRWIHSGVASDPLTTAAVSNLDLDAAGEYALLEWNGSKWNVIYTNGTIS